MPDEAAVFDALADEFFAVWFRYHPDIAAEVRVAGYERLLPAQSDDELAALGGWLENLVVALEEIDYGRLTRDQRVDMRLMFGAARVEHLELLERDWRHRDPLRFMPVAEIYHLALQPPADLREAIAALLGAVPEYLRLAVSQLRSMAELVSPTLVGAAVDEAGRGLCYLRELVESPWLRRHCYSFSEIETLAEGACGALSAYAETLRSEIAPRAAGRPGCGESHLRFLFQHRHFMSLDAGGARAVLADALGRCDQDFAALCASEGVAPERVGDRLRERSVEAPRRLEVCRGESERLAGFLAGAGLVSLPDAELRVSERPACPRPQRFNIDYMADRERRAGTYFLSRAASSEGVESLASLRARCIDKTWAGDHLLAFSGGEAPWRLPRRLCAGASLRGAWRLYVRDRLIERGYMEPDDHLLALMRQRRAIRHALLDLDLHLGVISDEDARARLAEDGGDADLVRLSRHPGDALAGALGWLALNRAREQTETLQGAAFSEGDFHDRLLAHGPIPLPLILDAELGSEASRAILS